MDYLDERGGPDNRVELIEHQGFEGESLFRTSPERSATTSPGHGCRVHGFAWRFSRRQSTISVLLQRARLAA